MPTRNQSDQDLQLKGSIPILVVGGNRSGTKWLSNIVANHPNVASVQGKRFKGILETNMLGIMENKFDLRYPDDYAAFVEVWTRSDYFQICGLDQEWFVTLLRNRNWPRSTVEILALLLQAFAHREKKQYWLQKTAPANALAILDMFPTARILAIQRNMKETVASTLQLAANQSRHLSIFKAVYGYVVDTKLLSKIRRRRSTCLVRYEELCLHPEKQIQVVCEYLGIDYSDRLLEVPFERNSSFSSGQTIKVSHWAEPLFAAASFAIPLSLANSIRGVRKGFARRPDDAEHRFVSDTFASIKDRWKIE